MAMISEYYEVFKDQTINDLSFSFSGTDYEFLKQILDYGFEFSTARGQIYLDKTLSTYKQAVANLIFGLTEEMCEHFSTIKEYRFSWDAEAMRDEIYLVYMKDESRTIGEIVDDLQSDWTPSEQEFAREKADMSDEYETQRHPDEKKYAGTKLLNNED